MKRILSAYQEQTLWFESECSYRAFVQGLERKRIRYRIVEESASDDAGIRVKIQRAYAGYPMGADER